MRYEIGSHFEMDRKNIQGNKDVRWLHQTSDDAYTFLGRTAIAIVLKNILQEKEIKNVYMPSYSCASMIEPFIEQGINVEYYDVYNNELGINYYINPRKNCDIFFAMTYFGIEDTSKMDEAIEFFSKRGVIVIEDITHRLLSQETHSANADYYIASLRKWFPIASGGYVAKRDGNLHFKPSKSSDHLVIPQIDAMKSKSEYLKGIDVLKEEFLAKFNSFTKIIKNVDERYMIDDYSRKVINSLDINTIRIQRRENANTIYSEMKNIKSIKPLIPMPDLSTHCPLFVPITVQSEKRDNLRSYLIQNNIYCPVHWPKKTQGKNSILSDVSISLVCDQRYYSSDMKYIINLIKKWEKDNI